MRTRRPTRRHETIRWTGRDRPSSSLNGERPGEPEDDEGPAVSIYRTDVRKTGKGGTTSHIPRERAPVCLLAPLSLARRWGNAPPYAPPHETTSETRHNARTRARTDTDGIADPACLLADIIGLHRPAMLFAERDGRAGRGEDDDGTGRWRMATIGQ